MADGTPMDPAPAGTKTDEKEKGSEAKAEKAGATEQEQSKSETRESKVDHGERSDVLKAQDKQRAEVAKDPWGTTPAQMRDDHEDPPDGRGAKLDGLNPHLTEEKPVTGGTLPPV